MAHVQGTVIVNLKKNSQALHNSFAASFTLACYYTLDRAIYIFLLVRQQLERIDQNFTQTLRCRMGFKNFCPTGITTCLYHQQPVGRSPFLCFSTYRAPPTAVLLSGRMQSSKRKLLQCGHTYDRVTPFCPPAGTMMHRRKSVLFDTIPCSTFKLPVSSFATFFKSLAYSFEGPSRRAYFNLENSFVFLQISVFLNA